MRFPVTRRDPNILNLPVGGQVLPATQGGFKGVLTVRGRTIEVGPYSTQTVVCSALRQEAKRHGLN